MRYLLKTLAVLWLVFSSFQLTAQEQATETKTPAQKALYQMIEEAKGQVIYLDFWASWCKPCRKSFPWLNEMQAKYQDRGFKVIGVNLDADKSFAEEFLAEIPAHFDMIYDDQGATARELKVRGMPSSYLIDREGNFVARHVGFKESKKPEYEQEIIKFLDQ